MDDRNEIVRELSTPLASGRGWIKFLAILTIIGGVLQALTIIGILVAWLPIWLGVLLFQTASGMEQASISGDTAAFVAAQNKLKLYFMIQGILIIIAFAFAVLFLMFGGMALIATMAAHRNAASTF